MIGQACRPNDRPSQTAYSISRKARPLPPIERLGTSAGSDAVRAGPRAERPDTGTLRRTDTFRSSVGPVKLAWCHQTIRVAPFHRLAWKGWNMNVPSALGDKVHGRPRKTIACLIAVFVVCASLRTPSLRGQDAPSGDPPKKTAKPVLPKVPKHWLQLTKDHEIWLDTKNKQLIVGGRVCLREGLLEMFACPKGTKEHESVVAVNTPARFVHAGLLYLGAKPGPPVQFEPKYRPAGGTPILVEVLWTDQDGKQQRTNARQWVKHAKTGKALEYPWVFAGSGFWTDEQAGQRYYYADGGEFICVSNFSTAMLDLPVASSDANDTLMFCAFTEHIPPRGTPVRLVLTPQLDKTEKASKKPAVRRSICSVRCGSRAASAVRSSGTNRPSTSNHS